LDRIARKAKHTILLNKNASLLIKKQNGLCLVCKKALLINEVLEINHRKSRKLGGSNITKNLALLHKTCHKQITHSKSKKLQALWVEEKRIIL
jgi:RNA-directed DNA polymerase